MQNKYLEQRKIATTKLIGHEWPQWMMLCGYMTNTMELAHIFDVNPHTLRQRLKAGWPIEAALVANLTNERWNINDVDQLQKQKWVKIAVKQTLTEFFTPSPIKNKKQRGTK